MELRLRQTIIGADDFCFASNESVLSSSGLGSGIAFGVGVFVGIVIVTGEGEGEGGGESSFRFGFGILFLILFNTRWRSWWAVVNSMEDLGKNMVALLKRSMRSR